LSHLSLAYLFLAGFSPTAPAPPPESVEAEGWLQNMHVPAAISRAGFNSEQDRKLVIRDRVKTGLPVLWAQEIVFEEGSELEFTPEAVKAGGGRVSLIAGSITVKGDKRRGRVIARGGARVASAPNAEYSALPQGNGHDSRSADGTAGPEGEAGAEVNVVALAVEGPGLEIDVAGGEGRRGSPGMAGLDGKPGPQGSPARPAWYEGPFEKPIFLGYCDTPPGRGGSGGHGGDGGKGGDGGAGGAGGSVTVVTPGPMAAGEHFFVFRTRGGSGGEGGAGGTGGKGGPGGPEGRIAKDCPSQNGVGPAGPPGREGRAGKPGTAGAAGTATALRLAEGDLRSLFGFRPTRLLPGRQAGNDNLHEGKPTADRLSASAARASADKQ
jgi:hypothetical protein